MKTFMDFTCALLALGMVGFLGHYAQAATFPQTLAAVLIAYAVLGAFLLYIRWRSNQNRKEK